MIDEMIMNCEAGVPFVLAADALDELAGVRAESAESAEARAETAACVALLRAFTVTAALDHHAILRALLRVVPAHELGRVATFIRDRWLDPEAESWTSIEIDTYVLPDVREALRQGGVILTEVPSEGPDRGVQVVEVRDEAEDLGAGDPLPPAETEHGAPPRKERNDARTKDALRRVDVLIGHLARSGPATRAQLKDDLAARLNGHRGVDATLEYAVRRGAVERERGRQPKALARKHRGAYQLSEQGKARAAELSSAPR